MIRLTNRHPSKEVRKTCIETLVHFSDKLDLKERFLHSYLRPSSLAANLYRFLKDGDPEVRQIARQVIVRLGAYGRQALIKGIRTESMIDTKLECIAGLAEFGPVSTRAIIMALRGEADLRVGK